MPSRKKVPFFGKVELEPREIDLFAVGLDRGEVGINGQVSSDRLSEPVPDIEAAAEIGSFVFLGSER